MALIVTFHNDGSSGSEDVGNYNVEVYVNRRLIAKRRIEGHRRELPWEVLVRRLVSDDGTLDTLYCGRELVGGWCKRYKGHQGDCACS